MGVVVRYNAQYWVELPFSFRPLHGCSGSIQLYLFFKLKNKVSDPYMGVVVRYCRLLGLYMGRRVSDPYMGVVVRYHYYASV